MKLTKNTVETTMQVFAECKITDVKQSGDTISGIFFDKLDRKCSVSVYRDYNGITYVWTDTFGFSGREIVSGTRPFTKTNLLKAVAMRRG